MSREFDPAIYPAAAALAKARGEYRRAEYVAQEWRVKAEEAAKRYDEARREFLRLLEHNDLAESGNTGWQERLLAFVHGLVDDVRGRVEDEL